MCMPPELAIFLACKQLLSAPKLASRIKNFSSSCARARTSVWVRKRTTAPRLPTESSRQQDGSLPHTYNRHCIIFPSEQPHSPWTVHASSRGSLPLPRPMQPRHYQLQGCVSKPPIRRNVATTKCAQTSFSHQESLQRSYKSLCQHAATGTDHRTMTA